MFAWLQRLIARNIVADVPAEMDLCLDCGRLECSEGEYRACARRMEHAARLAEAMTAERAA